jgi:hypothetical protein
MKAIERLAFVALLVIIVIFMLALIATGTSMNPGNELIFRFIFAVAAALIAFTMGGVVGLEWNFSGVAIRAGGAIAAFLIVFMFAPRVLDQVLPKAEPAVTGGNAIDFRSVDDPKQAQWLSSDLAITLEGLTFLHLQGNTQSAYVTSEELTFNIGGRSIPFSPAWLVDIRENTPCPGWRAVCENWKGGLVPANELLSRSVMFVPKPRGQISWEGFVTTVEHAQSTDTFSIKYEAKVSDVNLKMSCIGKIEELQGFIAYVKQNGATHPRYMQPSCEVPSS